VIRHLAGAALLAAVVFAGAPAGVALADPHQNSYCRDRAYREAHLELCPIELASPPKATPSRGHRGGSGGLLGDLLGGLGLGGLL
jgi:hypothetical protein